MNVIVSNKQSDLLRSLNINIIKSVTGEFSVEEIASMFQNMIYSKMILDLTAVKDYKDIINLQNVSNYLETSKLILLLPKEKEVITTTYLSKLVDIGIYNFTTNLEGIKYLVANPNNYKDVSHIKELGNLTTSIKEKVANGCRIIGIKNLTSHAGATSLIYMLKREMEKNFDKNVYAIEVDSFDFFLFKDKKMLSVDKKDLYATIRKLSDADVIFIDFNDDTEHDDASDDILYLLEPSVIKINSLINKNRNIFNELKTKKIVLNKCLLSDGDVKQLEYETNKKFYFKIPPLNDREDSDILEKFINKLGINEKKSNDDGKILGFFKK